MGIVGTLVWDRIVPADPRAEALEEWGGIAYSMAAALAALPPSWRVRPLVRVGQDVIDEAAELFTADSRVDASGVEVVPEPNNRVELRYRDHADRTEILGGGVSGWTGTELARRAADCDGLLVNFISGHEVCLEEFEAVRLAYPGPMYVDLHSLFMGIDEQGKRLPRSLVDWRRWCACADAVQMNQHEFDLLDGTGDPAATMASVLDQGPRLVFVTRGERGVSWLSRSDDHVPPRVWRTDEAGAGHACHAPERPGPRQVTVPSARRGDPTGCGDIWGSVLFGRMLAGDPVASAVEVANRLAAHSVEHVGTSGLLDHLQAELN